MIDQITFVTLVLIMFSIGSGLTATDVRQSLRSPKSIMLGLGFQMVLLPLLAVAIVVFSPLSPNLKIGLILIALCPGGTTSNFISYLVGLDVPLSLALTLINSVLITVTIPLGIGLALNIFSGTEALWEISVGEMVTETVTLLLLPTLVGFFVRKLLPDLVKRFNKQLKVINSLLLGSVFTAKALLPTASGGTGISAAETMNLLPYCLLLHGLSMLLSFYLSRKAVSRITATTIGVEVGLQNAALAILVASAMLRQPDMAKPALVFALFSFFTTLAFALWANGTSAATVLSVRSQTPQQ